MDLVVNLCNGLNIKTNFSVENCLPFDKLAVHRCPSFAMRDVHSRVKFARIGKPCCLLCVFFFTCELSCFLNTCLTDSYWCCRTVTILRSLFGSTTR